MKMLFWGSIIFCLALCVHLIVWKVRIPKSQTKTLLQIFMGTLFICLIAIWCISRFAMAGRPWILHEFSDHLNVILFFVSLTLAYVATYSAIEVDSPSLLIIKSIAESGNSGLDRGKLYQVLNDELLVKSRIRDLVNDGFICLRADKYKLTSRGFLLARIFIFYRKLLNIGKGG
jgi:uncharacterized protein YacL